MNSLDMIIWYISFNKCWYFR